MFHNLIAVFIGGGMGSILRYLTSYFFQKSFKEFAFPYPTLLVNLLGCICIGIIIGLIHKQSYIDQRLVLLFVTGFCGGFTTFSTFALENSFLIKEGHLTTALIYTAISVLVGISAVFLGLSIFKHA